MLQPLDWLPLAVPAAFVIHYVPAWKNETLLFIITELAIISLAVWIVAEISGDGECNWLEGVQLLSVYLIIGILYFFLPERDQSIKPDIRSAQSQAMKIPDPTKSKHI